jgi:hypothetical protein
MQGTDLARRRREEERLQKDLAKDEAIDSPPNWHAKAKRYAWVGARMGLVILLVHIVTIELERHGIFARFGRTSDFVFGSIVDYSLFGFMEE